MRSQEQTAGDRAYPNLNLWGLVESKRNDKNRFVDEMRLKLVTIQKL